MSNVRALVADHGIVGQQEATWLHGLFEDYCWSQALGRVGL